MPSRHDVVAACDLFALACCCCHLLCLQLWPTDLVPPRPVGKMVLDTNIDNFFAEAEQIAFCPAITVPGEDLRLTHWKDTDMPPPRGFNKLVSAVRCRQNHFLKEMLLTTLFKTARAALAAASASMLNMMTPLFSTAFVQHRPRGL